jgi:hypothetical protein
MTTHCPAGAFAIAGGWESSGADMPVTERYPSQLPGAGAGAWTLTVRRLAKGPALVVP